jgi:hypothetical protein
VHALQRRSEPAKLVPERQRGDIAAMKKEIGRAADLETSIRERTRAPRKVRIGDDGDAAQASDASRNLPSR